MEKIVVANWKMHKTAAEAKQFLLKVKVPSQSSIKVWVAPPFTAIAAAIEAAKNITVGAQNMYTESEGAFTGEISANMLASLGAKFVIVGHSERRALFHETDSQIAQKIKLAHAFGLLPILCVGESEEERARGATQEVLSRQLKAASGPIVIAYEPTWAIGTGKVATPAMVSETHTIIRKALGRKDVPIIYGGSVNGENAPTLLKTPLIDGVLVGSASLDVQKFNQIIQGAL